VNRVGPCTSPFRNVTWMIGSGSGVGMGDEDSDAEGLTVGRGVDGVGVAPFSDGSGRRSTKRTMTTITEPTITSHRTDDLMRSTTHVPSFSQGGSALVYAFPNFERRTVPVWRSSSTS
jgi:hypothetical protein